MKAMGARAPALGVIPFDDEPDGAPGRKLRRPRRSRGPNTGPAHRQPLGVEPPPLDERRDAEVLAELGQARELLRERDLDVVAGIDSWKASASASGRGRVSGSNVSDVVRAGAAAVEGGGPVVRGRAVLLLERVDALDDAKAVRRMAEEPRLGGGRRARAGRARRGLVSSRV